VHIEMIFTPFIGLNIVFFYVCCKDAAGIFVDKQNKRGHLTLFLCGKADRYVTR